MNFNEVLAFYKKNSESIQRQNRFTDSSQQLHFELLCGDMSYKRFFRVHVNDQSYILLIIPTVGAASIETFAPEQELKMQQLAICPAAAFINTALELAAHVPQVSPVHAFDSEAGLILLTDHGNELLENHLKKSMPKFEIIIFYFEKIFAWIQQFQTLPNKISADFFALQRTFEKNALLIELDEYIKYGVAYYEKGHEKVDGHNKTLRENFLILAENVSIQPLAFIHRDFQSKNILVQNQNFWIIDYQDLCFGPYTYDYASIIYDPYLDLPSELQEKLIQRCWEMNLQQSVAFEKFRQDLQLCAIQRLLKAAGRYARHLALNGKDTHMKYYQPAVDKARELMGDLL